MHEIPHHIPHHEALYDSLRATQPAHGPKRQAPRTKANNGWQQDCKALLVPAQAPAPAVPYSQAPSQAVSSTERQYALCL
jgi:hypothetical protein